jgi:hypothetical protein
LGSANQWVVSDTNLRNRENFLRKTFLFLNFWRWWWKISGRDFVGEIALAVRAVTEGLIGRLATAAESDGGASAETEFIAGWIVNLEIAFDEDGAVIFESDLCWHLFSLGFW